MSLGVADPSQEQWASAPLTAEPQAVPTQDPVGGQIPAHDALTGEPDTGQPDENSHDDDNLVEAPVPQEWQVLTSPEPYPAWVPTGRHPAPFDEATPVYQWRDVAPDDRTDERTVSSTAASSDASGATRGINAPTSDRPEPDTQQRPANGPEPRSDQAGPPTTRNPRPGRGRYRAYVMAASVALLGAGSIVLGIHLSSTPPQSTSTMPTNPHPTGTNGILPLATAGSPSALAPGQAGGLPPSPSRGIASPTTGTATTTTRLTHGSQPLTTHPTSSPTQPPPPAATPHPSPSPSLSPSSSPPPAASTNSPPPTDGGSRPTVQ